MYLLSLVNVEFRQSARLAGKPRPGYKETRDRKPIESSDKPKGPVVGNNEKDQGGDGRTSVDKESEATKKRPRSDPCGPETQLLEVSGGLGIEFLECIRNRYGEDPFFKSILDNPGDFTNFKTREGLTFFMSEGVEVVTIPDIKVNGQGVRELLI